MAIGSSSVFDGFLKEELVYVGGVDQREERSQSEMIYSHYQQPNGKGVHSQHKPLQS